MINDPSIHFLRLVDNLNGAIFFLDVHFGERTELAWPEIALEGLKGTLGSFVLDDCIDGLFSGNVLCLCRI